MSKNDNKTPDPVIVEKLMEFLGVDGISFFEMCMEEYESYTPVWSERLENGTILPHPVHLREGMQVRNYLRHASVEDQTDGSITIFTSNHLDDIYVGYIDAALKLCMKKRVQHSATRRMKGTKAALNILGESGKRGAEASNRLKESLSKEPCDHPGCANHRTHPCEKCGIIWFPELESMVDKALKRPHDYFEMPERAKWEIDNALCILDWEPTKEEVNEFTTKWKAMGNKI